VLLREALSRQNTPLDRLIRAGQPDLTATPQQSESMDINAVNPDIYHAHRKLNPSELAELAVLYEAGTSMVELGKKFECNRLTIARQLKKAGVKLREQKIRTPDFNERAKALYEQGNSLEEVAEMLGVQGTTINRAVRAAGGELRVQGRRRMKT
jgi:DNA-directed RNA polymerase specialized sigma24 family protein